MYDSTEDTRKHQEIVRAVMHRVIVQFVARSIEHDRSKLMEPEKTAYDRCVPRLKAAQYGSEEYKAAARDLGDGLKHHFEHNRHHPEHFPQGICGMTLIDVIEMVCDWYARASENGSPVRLEENAKRFHIEPQLAQIIANTVAELQTRSKD
ncbi:MAG: DUF5662 family protein [Acidobacteria bacterium]|nr:DUF5662 family protein [Acidobacteriota bacterium]